MAPRSLGDGQTDGIIEASALAQTVVETMREERFRAATPRSRSMCAEKATTTAGCWACSDCASARLRVGRRNRRFTARRCVSAHRARHLPDGDLRLALIPPSITSSDPVM